MIRKRSQYDKKREYRIAMEAVVDCYGSDELAMGWYYYLEDRLQFPFTAVCIKKRAVSPLPVNRKVEVTGMAPEDECNSEIFVTVRWMGRGLAVPLSQLCPVRGVDKTTSEAVEDWRYWVKMGYTFG